MTIAGITILNSQVKSFDSKSPSKNQVTTRSISGINIEKLSLNYIHRYSLKLQSLSTNTFKTLYAALLALDQTTGQLSIAGVAGEVISGIVHIPITLDIPSTITFDFDLVEMDIEPFNEYYNCTIPLSVYVAV